jgi:hypothetical protein
VQQVSSGFDFVRIAAFDVMLRQYRTTDANPTVVMPGLDPGIHVFSSRGI